MSRPATRFAVDVTCTALVLALCGVMNPARAQQDDPAPSFPGAEPAAASPSAAPPPQEPAAATAAPSPSTPPSSTTSSPSASPPPPSVAPAPYNVTPLEPSPPPAVEAPVKEKRSPPAAVGPNERCAESGPSRGLFKVGLPLWAAGLVAGGAVGALALAGAGLVTAGLWNLAVLRGVLPAGPLQGSLILLLPAAGIFVGGAIGGIIGAVVAPFLPRLGLQKPCTQVQDADPTLRRNKSTSGGGLNT